VLRLSSIRSAIPRENLKPKMPPVSPFLPLLASGKHADIDLVFLHALLLGEGQASSTVSNIPIGESTTTVLPVHRAVISALAPGPLKDIVDGRQSLSAVDSGREAEDMEPSGRPQSLVSLTYPTHPAAPSLVLKWIYSFPLTSEETAEAIGIGALDDAVLLSAVTTAVELDVRNMAEHLASVLHLRVTKVMADWKAADDSSKGSCEDRLDSMLKAAAAVGMGDLVREFAAETDGFEARWPKVVESEAVKMPETIPVPATLEPIGSEPTTELSHAEEIIETTPEPQLETVIVENAKPMTALERTATALRAKSIKRTPTIGNYPVATTEAPSEPIPEDPSALMSFLELQSPSNAVRTLLAYFPLHSDLPADNREALWDAVDWPRLSEQEWDELLGKISSGEVATEVGVRAVLERAKAMADALTLDEGADIDRISSVASTLSANYAPLGLSTPETGLPPTPSDIDPSALPSPIPYMPSRDSFSKLPLDMVVLSWEEGREPSGVPSPTVEIRQNFLDEQGAAEQILGLGHEAEDLETSEVEASTPKPADLPVEPTPAAVPEPDPIAEPSSALTPPATADTEGYSDEELISDAHGSLNRAFSFQTKKNDESSLTFLHQAPSRPASYAGAVPSVPMVPVGALPPRKGSLASNGRQGSGSVETLVGGPQPPAMAVPPSSGMAAAWLRQQQQKKNCKGLGVGARGRSFRDLGVFAFSF
jgi:hypothetical protein